MLVLFPAPQGVWGVGRGGGGPPPPPPPPSTEFETRRGLDGIKKLVPHQVLVAELGQFEQVHAGAGGGQALQVVAPVVDAEGRVQLLHTWAQTF